MPRQAQPKSLNRSRGDVSRELIIEAALALIDAEGLDALSMRDLAAALGVSTMGLYRYFKNKPALLESIVDRITIEFAPTAMTGGWQAQARALSSRVRASMLKHPHLADLVGREFRRSPTSLRVNTEIIERLHISGVPAPLLPEVYWTISSYTTGYAMLEAQSLLRRRDGGAKASRVARVRKIAAILRETEGVPHHATQIAANVLSQPLDDAQFRFGLDCLIKGIEAQIAAHRDA